MATSTAKIAALNDQYRRAKGGFFATASIAALPRDRRATLVNLVTEYDNWDKDNDPYGEHDFGAVTLDGVKYFWKINYYDTTLERHSPDPSDPAVTQRVMTVCRADEY